MHQTEIIFSVLVISAFTVSAQDYNVTITFQETENCENDCFEILFKFMKGENFTNQENVTWDKTISGNINNFNEIVRALQRLVENTHDDTSQNAPKSIVSSTTTRSSEHIKAQHTATSDQNNPSVPAETSSSNLTEPTVSARKQTEASTERIPAKSSTITKPNKDSEKPSKRSHEAETGVLITLTVVIIIIAGAWFGRKYYLRGTTESYFLLR